ncbi:hypothetical protein BOSP111201_26440 [Bordetella sputigena]
MLVRPIAERLAKRLGQSVIVENRSGAGAAIGTAHVAAAAADGYTFLIGAAGGLFILPRLRHLPYNPDTDLTPVAYLGDVISGLAVTPGIGVKTLPELIEKAKKAPGTLHYSSAGYGTTSHIRGELFARQAGIQLAHVPYRSNADAMPDLLSGNIQMMFESIVFPSAKAGKLNLLAIVDDRRYELFPDVPTMAELGFPNFKIPLWYVLYAPAHTPAPIVERVNREIADISKDPDFQKAMLAQGYRLKAYPVKELDEYMKGQRDMYAKLIKEMNIKLD